MNQVRAADYPLVSYPRSGRTWIAKMLGEYLDKQYGVASPPAALQYAHILNPQAPAAAKTHFYAHTIPDVHTKGLILVVRNIMDTLISRG